MLSVSLCNMFIQCGVPSITKPCIEIYLQKNRKSHKFAVAYLRFHFGGGGSKVFWKSGGIAWCEAPCSAWQSHAFARGVRGHASPRIF